MYTYNWELGYIYIYISFTQVIIYKLPTNYKYAFERLESITSEQYCII